MAIVALEVPRGVCQYLTRLNVPGERTPMEEMHVTIVQIDEEMTPVQVATITGAVREACVALPVFQAMVDHVTCFPGNDNGVPVICPVVSDGLHALHDVIVEALDARGIAFSKRFPEYKPHTTLAWSHESLEPMSLVRPITWTAAQVAMWPTRNGAFQSVQFDLRRRRVQAP